MTMEREQRNGHDLPVNTGIAHTDHKDQVKDKIRKQQEKILEPLVPMLKQFLEPGEEILLAAQSVSPFSLLEQLTTGWSLIYVVKRCVLVVTDRRILHFPATWKIKSKNIICQIRFGDIESIKVKSRSLRITYQSGKKERFSQIRNAKKLRTIVETLELRGQAPTTARSRHHLCPRCTKVLRVDSYTCPSCRLEFKNPARARWLSILLPGGGYFYTGHPFMGIVDFLVEAYLLVMVLLFAFVGFEADTPEGGSATLIAAGFFALVLVIEKVVTIYHAQHYVREFIPVPKVFQRLKAQA